MEGFLYLPLVSREWKNGSHSSYNCTPFLHSLLTKSRFCRQLPNIGAYVINWNGVFGYGIVSYSVVIIGKPQRVI